MKSATWPHLRTQLQGTHPGGDHTFCVLLSKAVMSSAVWGTQWDAPQPARDSSGKGLGSWAPRGLRAHTGFHPSHLRMPQIAVPRGALDKSI